MSDSTGFARRWMIAAATLILFTPASRAGAQANPFLGTWELNVAKSKHTPGPAPKQQTTMYEAAGDGIKVTTSGTDAAGNPISTSFTANFDGKDYPVAGNPDYDMVMW